MDMVLIVASIARITTYILYNSIRTKPFVH